MSVSQDARLRTGHFCWRFDPFVVVRRNLAVSLISYSPLNSVRVKFRTESECLPFGPTALDNYLRYH